MKTFLAFILSFLLFTGYTVGQTIKTVGATGADFATLRSAVEAINAGTLTGAITLQIIGSTTEPTNYEINLNASGTGNSIYSSILIYPTVSGLTINMNYAPALRLDGADNVTIDGRVNATGSTPDLTLTNINTGGPTISFRNSAENNTVKYCYIKGNCASSSLGVVEFFTSTSGNGNSGNTISNCNITNAGSRVYSGIHSSGGSISNKNNSIINCNLYDLLQAFDYAFYIFISSNSTDFTITGNSMYETTTIAPNADMTWFGIDINASSTGSFTISNNYIGGKGPACSGGPMTITASPSTTGVSFIGITLRTNTNISVQGNTVSNIAISASKRVSGEDLFRGIEVTAGNVDIGNISGNTIGSPTGNGSIQLTYTSLTGSAESYGIYMKSPGNVTIANNSIGSITAIGSLTTSHSFTGIFKATFTGTLSVTNNLIGSLTTSNSIQAPSASTSATAQNIYGIYSTSTGLVTISNNTIANLYNAYDYPSATNGQVAGITTGSGINTIQNNIVRDLSSTSPCNSTTFYAAVIGIVQKSNIAGQVVSNNTMYNLKSTYTGGRDVHVIGIHYSGATTGTNIVENNFIHSLTLSASSITSAISGIRILSGACTYANNIINLGSGITTGYAMYGIYQNGTSDDNNKIYFNTIYLFGSRSGDISSTYALYNNDNLSTRDIRNNILFNAVSGGTTGKNYSIRLAGTNNVTINYNDYFVSGASSVLGRFGNTDKADLAAWKQATGQDANSLNINPGFANAGGSNALDYYASATLPGVSGTGITTDYSGLTRPSTPKMGALESNNYVWQGASSTDFNTASNWQPAEVPPAGADITFAASPSNNCVLDGNRSVGNIINAQATYKLVTNGHQLTISKNLNLSNGAQVDASSNNSAIVFSGAAAQSIPANAFVSNTVDALVLENNTGLTLNGNLTINQGLTLTSGTFTIGANTLTLNGGISFGTGTLIGGAASNIIIGGTGASTTLPAITLNNLTLNRSNGITLGGNVTIGGALALSAGTLAIGANVLTVSGSSPTSAGGTVDASNAAAELVFSNASAITLPSTFFSGAVNNLTISGAGGVTASSDITVNGVLNLAANNPSDTHGLLEMTISYANYPGTTITDYLNSHILNMGATATTIGLGDVTGTVKRTTIVANTPYSFGNEFTTISLTPGTMPSALAVSITIGTTAKNTKVPYDIIDDAMRRTYEIVPTGGSGCYVTANFHYLDSELQSSNDPYYTNSEQKLTTMDYDIQGGYDYSDEHGRANYDYINNYIGLSSVPISYFIQVPVIHEWRTIFALRDYGVDYYTWNGSISNAWETPENWTLSNDGAGIPTELSHVIIPDAATTPNDPVLPTGSTTINTLSIENGGILTMGSNTLVIQNTFSGGWEDQNPLGNDPGTSTVVFALPSSYEILPHTTISGNARFYNVEINDGVEVTNQSGNKMKIAGSISKTETGTGKWYADVFDATIEYNGDNQTVLLPDGTPDYHNLILSGSGTKTMPASVMNISGNMTISGTAYATAAAAISIEGNLNVEEGATFGTGTFSHEVKSNISCNGTIVPASGSLFTMNGAAPQAIDGVAESINLGDLTISNLSGVSLFTPAVTANLNIESGTLTVVAGTPLTVVGETNLNSAECLVLRSDAEGAASFIDNGTINGSGTALIERYLTPYDEVSDQKFHFLSSPVSNSQAIEPEFIDLASTDITDFYKWDEPSNLWINFRGSAFNVRNENFGDGFNFVAGKGYLVAYPNSVVKNFTGKPYTNTTGLTVNCTNTSGGGWNLLGNPFPSAIDWSLVTKTNVDNALYYYDNTTAPYVYHIDLTGGNGPGTQYIPAEQGFMVHASAAGSITMENSNRVHQSLITYYKNGDSYLTDNVLNIWVEGNGKRDYARVCFYGPATENFDGEYDAYKLFSYNSNPMLYSLTPDNSLLAINTMPFSQMQGTVPVGFTPGTDGSFTFNAQGMENFAPDIDIVLNDLKLNTTQNLKENPVYTFTSSTSDEANRFQLLFGVVGIGELPTAQTVSGYYANGNLFVTTNSGVTNVNIYNMQGQLVQNYQLNGTGQQSHPLNLPPGIYIARLTSSNAITSLKLLVK